MLRARQGRASKGASEARHREASCRHVHCVNACSDHHGHDMSSYISYCLSSSDCVVSSRSCVKSGIAQLYDAPTREQRARTMLEVVCRSLSPGAICTNVRPKPPAACGSAGEKIIQVTEDTTMWRGTANGLCRGRGQRHQASSQRPSPRPWASPIRVCGCGPRVSPTLLPAPTPRKPALGLSQTQDGLHSHGADGSVPC